MFPIRHDACRRIALASCFAAGAAGAHAAVSIVSPDSDEILYGTTPVRVAVDGSAARVDVFLDRYPAPICRFAAPPYTCEFDAGTRLEGRILRAEAFDARGRSLGRDAIATYSFVESEQVVAPTLTVPLVASVDGRSTPDLHGAQWRCSYGGEPCEVLETRKLGDNVEGLSRTGIMRHARDPMTDRPPVSLEVLIDVSPSVWADRGKIEDALRRVIDETPTPVEISISEFAGIYHRLVPFTTSKVGLRRGLRALSDNRPWSCVLGAVRRSLAELHVRPGHKALLLISDAEETCEATRGDWLSLERHDPALDDAADTLGTPQPPEPQSAWPGPAIRARRGSIAKTLDLSRQVGIPIYFYRVGGDAVTSRNAVESIEKMAEESGGRWISARDLSALGEGLGALLRDLESTWMLDVSLPSSATGRDEARLELGIERPAGTYDLRYPVVWRGGNRDALLMTLLSLGEPRARAWAAERLRDSRDRGVLPALLAAYRTEASVAGRIEEMTAIYHVSAFLLLHGEEPDQRAALATIDELWEIDPVLVRRLQPALRTFQKMDPPRKLRLEAERLAGPSPPRPRRHQPRG